MDYTMDLGWAHGPPNSVTFWRCPKTQRQGLLFGRFSPETAKVYRDVACPCGEEVEITIYERSS